MRLSQHFLTKNDCYKAGRTIVPRGIMVHSTGANNTNITRYVSDTRWNKPGVKKCVHAFIGRDPDGNIATWQTLPWTMRGWHAGDDANNTHIGFEICEDDLRSAEYLEAVYWEAAELCAMLCREYGLDPLTEGVLICHSEGHKIGIASNHADVMHWWPLHGRSMDAFRTDVAALLQPAPPVPDDTQEEQEETDMRYKTLAEVPEWYRPAVEKLIASGALQGNGAALDLGEDMCRVFTVIDRLGLIPAAE